MGQDFGLFTRKRFELLCFIITVHICYVSEVKRLYEKWMLFIKEMMRLDVSDTICARLVRDHTQADGITRAVELLHIKFVK